MTTMTQEEVEQVFMDVMEIIRKRQMPLEMGYWMLGNALDFQPPGEFLPWLLFRLEGSAK